MHANQEPAALPIPTGPMIDITCQMAPTTQVEIADAEIRSFGNVKRFLKRGQQGFFNIVKNAWHGNNSVIAMFSGREECDEIAPRQHGVFAA